MMGLRVPLTDAQLARLLQIFLEQQRELMKMDAAVAGMAKVLVQYGGPDVLRQLDEATLEMSQSKRFDGARESIQAVEQVLVSLLPNAPHQS